MKRLLVICVIALFATTSSYSYTVFKSNYNSGSSQWKSYDYSPNAWVFGLRLYACRMIAPTGEQACYAAVSCTKIDDGGSVFYESAFSQYKMQSGYLETTRYSWTSNVNLRISLYCPEVGDYAQARIEW